MIFPNKAWWKSRTDATLIAERKGQLQKYLQSLLKIEEVGASDILKEWLQISNNPPFRSLSNPEKEGYLHKEDHVLKKWKKRWFVLKGDLLYCFKDDKLLNLKEVIHLNDLYVREATEKEHPFSIALLNRNSNTVNLFLHADDNKVYKEWLNILKVATSKFDKSNTLNPVQDQSQNRFPTSDNIPVISLTKRTSPKNLLVPEISHENKPDITKKRSSLQPPVIQLSTTPQSIRSAELRRRNHRRTRSVSDPTHRGDYKKRYLYFLIIIIKSIYLFI